MNIEEIKKYVKERDEMLLKCSVDELRTFVGKYEHFFNLMFVDAIARATDELLEITLHKMIINCTNLPFEFRQKSADWLLDRGYSIEIIKGGGSDA